MTGYGKAVAELTGKKLTLEIRSLNSKQLDLTVKVPVFLREKELDIRNLISPLLVRGKVDVYITSENAGDTLAWTINKDLARKYHAELKELLREFREDCPSGLLPVVVRMPDVVTSGQEDIAEDDWEKIRTGLLSALSKLEAFRRQEGKILEEDILMRVSSILNLLAAIEPLESNRIDTVRKSILRNLDNLGRQNGNGVAPDPNRFEQELIYYLEKMDFTEEKVRLKKHCDHFNEVLAEKDSQGRKLGFITQEMGREINTLGSKANDADIQKMVVNMKDELEKIKEQLLNIL
jgi:uncharacterized protein (TIGR00255 family)